MEEGNPPLPFPQHSPTPVPIPLPRWCWSDSHLSLRGGNHRAEERQLRWDSQTQKSPAKRHTPTLPMCILALQPLHISRASVEQMRLPVRRQWHPFLLTWLIWCQSCPCHRPQFGLTRQGHTCSVNPLGMTDHPSLLIWVAYVLANHRKGTTSCWLKKLSSSGCSSGTALLRNAGRHCKVSNLWQLGQHLPVQNQCPHPTLSVQYRDANDFYRTVMYFHVI